jgi:hypothetical protein
MPPSTGSVTVSSNQISVVIEPGASPIHARMRAALAELDEGTFTEGHDATLMASLIFGLFNLSAYKSDRSSSSSGGCWAHPREPVIRSMVP